MGRRGPKRKPAGVAIAQGTYRPDRHGDQAEAKPRLKIPNPPDWLAEIGQQVWSQVGPILARRGCLHEVDESAFSRYCQAWEVWHACREEIAEVGLTAVSEKGAVYQHPLVGVMNKADERLRKYEAAFGMTPSARTSIGKEPKSEAGGKKRFFGA
jgi:P27 family predicted phage terminase small subunit